MKESNVILLNKDLKSSAEAMAHCLSKRKRKGVVNFPGSPWFKEGSDMKDVIVMGHTGVDENYYPVNTLGGLDLDQFCEQFDREYTKAGKNKAEVERVWIIGCAFGLTLAEKVAEKFYEMGYTNAIIFAATPDDFQDNIVSTAVQITSQQGLGTKPKGTLTLIGFTPEDLEEKSELKKQINSTMDEREKRQLENQMFKVGTPILTYNDPFEALSQPQNRFVSNESPLKDNLRALNIIKKSPDLLEERVFKMEVGMSFAQEHAAEQIKQHRQELQDRLDKNQNKKKPNKTSISRLSQNLDILDSLLKKLEKPTENWQDLIWKHTKCLVGKTTKKLLRDQISRSEFEETLHEVRERHKPEVKREEPKSRLFFDDVENPIQVNGAGNIEQEKIINYINQYIEILKCRLESRKSKLGFLHDWFPGMIQSKINGLEEMVEKLEPKEAMDKEGMQKFLYKELQANPGLSRHGLERQTSRTEILLRKIISDEQPEEYVIHLKGEIRNGHRLPNEREEQDYNNPLLLD